MHTNQPNGTQRPVAHFYQNSAFPVETPNGQHSTNASTFETQGHPGHSSYGANPSQPTGPRPRNPAVDAYRRRDAAMARAPMPTFYSTNNDTGNLQYDAGVTHTLRVQAGARRAQDAARMNATSNLTEGSGMITSGLTSLPQYGQLFRRRGVPVEMFTHDMKRITAIQQRALQGNGCLADFFECCIPGPTAHETMMNQYKRLVPEMNQRYAPYQISWEIRFLPYVGCQISYQY